MSERMMNVPFGQVVKAVKEATVNRHEYMLTQASCHKRNCQCAVFGNGRPEDALKLIQETIIGDLQHLQATGETPRQTEIENALHERKLFEQWKKMQEGDDE